MAAIELFEFLLDGSYYRYTSGDVTIDKAGDLFTPAPIRRESIVHSDDQNRAVLRLTVLRDNPLAVAAATSRQPVTLTIFGEFEAAVWAILWKGRVAELSAQGAEIAIQAEPILTQLQRMALYAKYQLLCRHVLFDPLCGLSTSAFEFSGTVSAVDGVLVTVPGLNGQADGYYNGYAQFGSYDFRMIVNHVGNEITLYSAVPDLSVGAAALVYPGCNHSEANCTAKFSNLLNYGGFPWMPSGRNPFTDTTPDTIRQ